MAQEHQPLRPVKDLRDLLVWELGMDFAERAYRATQAFPAAERFGLQMQLRRAAVSVMSNVAEGHGRGSRRDYARFVAIARGSLKEAETQILLATRLGFVRNDAARQLQLDIQRLNQLLVVLHRRLREPS